MAITETTALISGIKGTIDIVKGLKAAYDAHTITQAQTELLQKLLALQMDALAVQEKQSAILNERDQLLKQVAEYENWSEVEKQHHIEEIHPQIYVYVANKPTTSLKTQPWYCANCFSQRQMSVLQSTENSHETYKEFLCHKCNAKISYMIEGGSHPPAIIVSRPDPFPGY